jgi:hypothetical protein
MANNNLFQVNLISNQYGVPLLRFDMHTGGLAPQILVGFFFKGPLKKLLTKKNKKIKKVTK